MIKKFRVLVRRDAWVDYSATIEADSAEEAAEIGRKAWKSGDADVIFTEEGLQEFDEIVVDPGDVEEIIDAS